MARIGVGIIYLLLLAFNPWALASDSCETSLKSTVAHHHSDLEAYISGMEKSSLQKAALGAVGRPGKMVDLGSGSGVSAHDLAILFPDSKVIGVDLDPGMVSYATDHYQARNLLFKVGNAEAQTFPANSLDTTFISSTLHHLTSYGTGEFDVDHVKAAIRFAALQSKVHGVVILRDFLIAEGPSEIYLELRNQDGKDQGEVPELSTAALFKKFAVDFRNSVHPRSGVPYEVLPASELGWTRFKLSLRDANEFLLRKDYRSSYQEEIKEEYTFMTQLEFEAAVQKEGLRVLHSAPVYNPWIIENRYRNQVRIFDLHGTRLPLPPTNYMIAAEKIAEGEGIEISESHSEVVEKPRFLRRHVAVDLKTKEKFDLVERPGSAVDLIPFFQKNKSLYVLAKQAYPRPIVTVEKGKLLTGFRPEAYVIEPVSFLVDRSRPLYTQIETQMQKRAGIDPSEVLRSGPLALSNLYTSPGLVNEKTQSMALPLRSRSVSLASPGEDYSGFSTSGVIRPVEATQLLRSAQVGAMLDARLELGVYQLLLKLQRSPGPWIGQDIKLKEAASKAKVTSANELLQIRNPQRRFQLGDESEFGSFLEVRRGSFSEKAVDGSELSNVDLEYVLPKNFSANVISVLPMMLSNGRYLIGLEHRHLPAVQMEQGTSNIITNPAWRLPRGITNLEAAEEFVSGKMSSLSGVKLRRFYELGGLYHPSKGLSPEVVYPLIAEVDKVETSHLQWVDLQDLIAARASIQDAHLMIAVLRAGHALGLLD